MLWKNIKYLSVLTVFLNFYFNEWYHILLQEEFFFFQEVGEGCFERLHPIPARKNLFAGDFKEFAGEFPWYYL